jgi:hypothetical protein
MKNLLENSNNPMKILDENKDVVAEIIGRQFSYAVFFLKKFINE